jgi:hypothetical protein
MAGLSAKYATERDSPHHIPVTGRPPSNNVRSSKRTVLHGEQVEGCDSAALGRVKAVADTP